MANVSRTRRDANPYGDAVARLSEFRQALGRGEAFGGGPAPDFDLRSGQVVGAAAAGLEALAAVDGHALASRDMVERIRRELAEISKLVLR